MICKVQATCMSISLWLGKSTMFIGKRNNVVGFAGSGTSHTTSNVGVAHEQTELMYM